MVVCVCAKWEKLGLVGLPSVTSIDCISLSVSTRQQLPTCHCID